MFSFKIAIWRAFYLVVLLQFIMSIPLSAKRLITFGLPYLQAMVKLLNPEGPSLMFISMVGFSSKISTAYMNPRTEANINGF